MNFTIDEKVYLNRVAPELSKEDFVAKIVFHSVANEGDSDMLAFFADLQTKVETMSEKEWSDLVESLPFDVPYGEFDRTEYDEDRLDEVA